MILLPQYLAYCLCREPQGIITYRMAMMVIDFLEAIEVEHGDRHRPIVPTAARAFLFGHLKETMPVERLCERIGRGKYPQLHGA